MMTVRIMLNAVMLSALVTSLLITAVAYIDSDAAAANNTGKTIIKYNNSHSYIPHWEEKSTLLKQYDNTQNETKRAQIQKQIDKLDLKIQSWLDSRFNASKHELAMEKKDVLTDRIGELRKKLGQEKAYKILPWVGAGYDYVNNALEIEIDSRYFTEDNILRYVDVIRNIVGSKVDITLTPGQLLQMQPSISKGTSGSESIKGGSGAMCDPQSVYPGNSCKYTGNKMVETRSPYLQQKQDGTAPEDVICSEDHRIVIKKSDGSAACIFPESVPKLINIGWAEELGSGHNDT